jgi:hypothetical protein
LILGANRDEIVTRPWAPPGRHWPDRPGVVAGLDRLAGGSWLGLNDRGVVAAMLNRRNSLGPAPGMRSRGGLVLDALEHGNAASGAEALRRIDVSPYRPFNMVVADAGDAFWLRHAGAPALTVLPVPEGIGILTSREMNDTESERIRTFLPRFLAAAAPEPGLGDWASWEAILADRTEGKVDGPLAAMTIVTTSGYGTVSSALIGLPKRNPGTGRAQVRFAAGRPGEVPYQPIQL